MVLRSVAMLTRTENKARALTNLARVSVAVVIAAGLALGTTGCATKGFVRGQMASLRHDMESGQDAIRSEMAEMRNSVDQALARAEAANGLAGSARDIALGKVGFHEVGRYTVNFDYNHDEMDGGSDLTLEEIASRLQSHPEYLVDVYGFTDSRGSTKYNYELGHRRAEAVVRSLAERVPGSLHRYASVSYGESTMPGETASDEQSRRRVEISLVERSTGARDDSISQSN